ncbi:hypothetical protein CHGG_03356 [Chaetomium globosum CBS 148.51]|uniref:Uncharacterized protein n=1 Tax=Chaetomium globosum (strain ATCC 6205 / CBS 148.51 / DSM 1962 / NBRC 6347 / NRRL 1970) TaxID=306901 RepID=Q2H8U8_CHAGB|nr:uncharacterized protein CHGG_03356 [Chaetomium globosum CBS 148.51]EAQ91421.1 hypothetical protein CHGG_03356 [Chaetomium globosum CBS 148.51]
MPKIKSFAPSWLNEPSPGHKLFAQSSDDARLSMALPYGKKPKPGPRRTIARRGTEVFVAVGKQIRWGDLAYLKESWETNHARSSSGTRIKRESPDDSFDNENGIVGHGTEGYRTIKTPVADDIRQLVMSPNQDLLAVLTSHTVHICILPDSSHLYAKDAAPFKPKFWTLGPTTHVTSRPAVVSALWHPLGVNGTALVTVTEDAVVRVWELSTADRWTFDSATLAIDLKRLADGTSLDQDFTASVSATNKGFSPDAFDMEVASACFPARGSGGWSPMTLVAATEDDPEASAETRLLAQQQLDWISDLDNQEPKVVEGSLDEAAVEVYTRPTRPGTIPKLQGPFEFDLNPEDEQDDEVELRDIYVIGEKARIADLMMGVEAQWLPPKPRHGARQFAAPANTPSLLTFQTFDTLKPVEVVPESWPVFSEDVTSRYSFYITHPAGITFVSLAPWVFRLESELQGDSESGAEFRLDLLVKGQGSERERIYTQGRGLSSLAAATTIKDPGLGHFVLSATHNDPVALFFDTPERESHPRESPAAVLEHVDSPLPEIGWEPRPLFYVSEALDRKSAVPAWIDHLKTGRRRPLFHQEVRLSMATLEVLTEGHKVLCNEVDPINDAVAELFRKCQMLQHELRSQIVAANYVKKKVDMITGEDSADDDEPPISRDDIVQDRLRLARERQEELASRMEKLKRQLGRGTSRELSDKEKAWAEEARALSGSILGSGADQTSSSTSKTKQPWKRFEEIQALRDALFSQAEQLQRAREGADSDAPASPLPGLRIPAEVRRQKMAQVIGLLDRESALVDAVKARIERLSIG